MACEWVSVGPVFIRKAVFGEQHLTSQIDLTSILVPELFFFFFSLEWNVKSQEIMMVETRRVEGGEF